MNECLYNMIPEFEIGTWAFHFDWLFCGTASGWYKLQIHEIFLDLRMVNIPNCSESIGWMLKYVCNILWFGHYIQMNRIKISWHHSVVNRIRPLHTLHIKSYIIRFIVHFIGTRASSSSIVERFIKYDNDGQNGNYFWLITKSIGIFNGISFNFEL